MMIPKMKMEMTGFKELKNLYIELEREDLLYANVRLYKNTTNFKYSKILAKVNTNTELGNILIERHSGKRKNGDVSFDRTIFITNFDTAKPVYYITVKNYQAGSDINLRYDNIKDIKAKSFIFTKKDIDDIAANIGKKEEIKYLYDTVEYNKLVKPVQSEYEFINHQSSDLQDESYSFTRTKVSRKRTKNYIQNIQYVLKNNMVALDIVIHIDLMLQKLTFFTHSAVKDTYHDIDIPITNKDVDEMGLEMVGKISKEDTLECVKGIKYKVDTYQCNIQDFIYHFENFNINPFIFTLTKDQNDQIEKNDKELRTIESIVELHKINTLKKVTDYLNLVVKDSGNSEKVPYVHITNKPNSNVTLLNYVYLDKHIIIKIVILNNIVIKECGIDLQECKIKYLKNVFVNDLKGSKFTPGKPLSNLIVDKDALEVLETPISKLEDLKMVLDESEIEFFTKQTSYDDVKNIMSKCEERFSPENKIENIGDRYIIEDPGICTRVEKSEKDCITTTRVYKNSEIVEQKYRLNKEPFTEILLKYDNCKLIYKRISDENGYEEQIAEGYEHIYNLV